MPNIGKHLAEVMAFPWRTPPFMLGALPDIKKTHMVFFVMGIIVIGKKRR